MLASLGNVICWAVLASALAACDGKPKHYYVLCEDRDGAGWRLTNYERDKNGYLTSCTYQSPDGNNWYTARCTDEGCD
jgi:hypothetical protein